MSSPRQPSAPAYADPSLSETAHGVLDVLRRRRAAWERGAAESPRVTRAELVGALRRQGIAVTDRSVREAVEELRGKAHPVVSTSAAAGYWLSRDAGEVRACAETYMSRIRHHAPSARGLLRAASALDARPETQGTLEGVLG